MLISALQHKSKYKSNSISKFFEKKIKFFGFHGVVLVKTFPLTYQLPTYVRLILRKPGRFLFSAYGNSGYGQNSISNYFEKNSNFWVFML